MFLFLFTCDTSALGRFRWLIFSVINASGAILTLSATGTTICIERDWVAVITTGQRTERVMLNSMLRRIDLMCKLVAPLVVSAITATAGYKISVIVLLVLTVGSATFEFLFIEIVYRKFPALHAPRVYQTSEQTTVREIRAPHRLKNWIYRELKDWREFAQHSVFLSMCCD
jgi:solute carrier family 40 (iron-regulated transporter), member 1